MLPFFLATFQILMKCDRFFVHRGNISQNFTTKRYPGRSNIVLSQRFIKSQQNWNNCIHPIWMHQITQASALSHWQDLRQTYGNSYVHVIYSSANPFQGVGNRQEVRLHVFVGTRGVPSIGQGSGRFWNAGTGPGFVPHSAAFRMVSHEGFHCTTTLWCKFPGNM